MLWDKNFYYNIPESIIDGIYYIDHSKRITYWDKDDILINNLLEKKESLNYDEYNKNIFYVEYSKILNDKEYIKDAIDNAILKSVELLENCISELYIFEKDMLYPPILIRIEPLFLNDIIGLIEVFTVNSKKISLLKVIQELIENNNYDPLTYIANSNFLYKNIEQKIDRYKRFNDTFGYILFKVDIESEINPNYYTQILRLIGINFLRNIRNKDIAARLNDSNFLCLISNITEEQLTKIKDRIKNNLENSYFLINNTKTKIIISTNMEIVKITDSLITIKEDIEKKIKNSE